MHCNGPRLVLTQLKMITMLINYALEANFKKDSVKRSSFSVPKGTENRFTTKYIKKSAASHTNTTSYNMLCTNATGCWQLKTEIFVQRVYNKRRILITHATAYAKQAPVNWRSSIIMQNKYNSLKQRRRFPEIVWGQWYSIAEHETLQHFTWGWYQNSLSAVTFCATVIDQHGTSAAKVVRTQLLNHKTCH